MRRCFFLIQCLLWLISNRYVGYCIILMADSPCSLMTVIDRIPTHMCLQIQLFRIYRHAADWGLTTQTVFHMSNAFTASLRFVYIMHMDINGKLQCSQPGQAAHTTDRARMDCLLYNILLFTPGKRWGTPCHLTGRHIRPRLHKRLLLLSCGEGKARTLCP